MMYGSMMGGFGFVFMVIYLAIVIYFFYLLTSITKSVKRIADKLDRMPVTSFNSEEEKSKIE
ncbi:MAG: hypothetical protein E6713_09560 [Sporomusaceae bacterium]|nr:hypothetical protein [Sporomusaceae bacterium]